jgi:hypothetical protein
MQIIDVTKAGRAQDEEPRLFTCICRRFATSRAEASGVSMWDFRHMPVGGMHRHTCIHTFMKTPQVFVYACKSVDVGFNARDPAGRARGAWGVSQHAQMERWAVPRYGIGGALQGKWYKEHARKDAQYVVLAHDVAGGVWACELVIGCLCVHACVMMSLGCMSQPQT